MRRRQPFEMQITEQTDLFAEAMETIHDGDAELWAAHTGHEERRTNAVVATALYARAGVLLEMYREHRGVPEVYQDRLRAHKREMERAGG